MLSSVQLIAATMSLLASGARAATTTTQDLFIDNMDPNAMWAASVIEVCNSSTTYAVACTSAPFNPACSQGATPITMTQGPSVFAVTTPAIYSETSVTIVETCALDSSASSASCVQTIEGAGYGQSNVMTKAFNLTGQYYRHYQVAITAGADKLGGSGTCSANAAARRGTQAAFCLGSLGIISLGFILVL